MGVADGLVYKDDWFSEKKVFGAYWGFRFYWGGRWGWFARMIGFLEKRFLGLTGVSGFTGAADGVV